MKKNKAEEKNEGRSEANSNAASKKGKKGKHKLQLMDIITIIFTAIILGVMGYVLYDQFSGSGGGSNNPVNNTPTSSVSTSSSGASSTPAPTAPPVLSDIGNNYGNISNGALEAIIDGREYFISADAEGDTHIYMTDGENTRDLIKTDASSLNVVTDYITYADQDGTKAYYVFYIDGDGKICYVSDGPLTKDAEAAVPLKANVFLDGKYSVINVSGEYLYYLNGEGQIGKISILDKTDTVLGTDRAYSNFCLYYGVIYAVGADDGYIYQMPSNPQTSTSDKDSDDDASAESNEKLLVGESCTAFAIDNDWIYTVSDRGIVRYLVDSGAKDTISSEIKADAINVRNSVIYYTSGGTLYMASYTEELLKNGAGTVIASVGGENGEYGRGIYAQENTVYVTDENGVLMKSVYDKESKAYGELTAMN